MQKLMKNWIFTLVTCVLLAILAVLVFLDSLGVGDVGLIRDVLHVLVAVILALYLIFALFPLLKRYRGTVQAFLIFEIALLLLVMVAQLCEQFFSIPILSKMQVCSVLGLALWLRGVVEIVHAYVKNGTADTKKTPLWQLCGYILLVSVGVWQMTKPLVKDRYFGFCIAAATLLAAAIFNYLTLQNRKTLHKKSKKDAAMGDAKALVAADDKKTQAK